MHIILGGPAKHDRNEPVGTEMIAPLWSDAESGAEPEGRSAKGPDKEKVTKAKTVIRREKPAS
jgi:hypothetical protein